MLLKRRGSFLHITKNSAKVCEWDFDAFIRSLIISSIGSFWNPVWVTIFLGKMIRTFRSMSKFPFESFKKYVPYCFLTTKIERPIFFAISYWNRLLRESVENILEIWSKITFCSCAGKSEVVPFVIKGEKILRWITKWKKSN